MKEEKTRKIVYIAREKIPNKTAASVHVAHICEELRDLCDEFLCVAVGEELNCNSSLIRTTYGLRQVFPIEFIPNFIKNRTWKFAKRSLNIILRERPSLVVTRDPLTAFFSVMIGNCNTVMDIHGDIKHLCGRFYHLYQIKRFQCHPKLQITTTTHALKEFYIENYGFDEKKITVLPNGYSPWDFENNAIPGKDFDLKAIIESRTDGKSARVGYVGSFFKDKGIDLIAKLSHEMSDVEFYLAGGTEEKAEEEIKCTFSEKTIFMGRIMNSQVPIFLKSMDVLLLPNKEVQQCNGEEIGRFTSPIKMFEYMASGVPIVASDVSAIREILSNANCFLVSRYDEAKAWASVISEVLNNKPDAIMKSAQAREDVEKYTWKNRAERIVNLFNK